MKAIFSIFSILILSNVYSQDSLKIKQIDILVSTINASKFAIRRDTIIQDHSESGYKSTSYLAIVTHNRELIKYVNNAKITITQNGVANQMSGENSFYYEHNKLIKVEEYLVEDGVKKEANWYYADDKPLYNTIQSDEANDRATLLFTLSKTILIQVVK